MRLFALAFVAGAFLLQQQRSLPEVRFALLGLAGALAWRLAAGRPLLAAMLAFASGLALGFGYAAWRAELRLAEALPAAREGRDVVVSGVVSGLPQERTEGTRFLFDVEDWGTAARGGAALPSTLSLAWYAHDEAMPHVVACERWRFTV